MLLLVIIENEKNFGFGLFKNDVIIMPRFVEISRLVQKLEQMIQSEHGEIWSQVFFSPFGLKRCTQTTQFIWSFIFFVSISSNYLSKQNQQYRQCTYNVTLSRVRSTIVAVGMQWVLHILSVCCSLWYSACNAQAQYCCLWPARP